MAEVSPVSAAPVGRVDSSLAYEEDPLPSLPNFEDIFRPFGTRSMHGHATSEYSAATALSPDDAIFDKNVMSNKARSRRMSSTTMTSIGRPRTLATRPKFKTHESRDAVTFVRDSGTRELSAFLWTNKPSPDNWVSIAEVTQTTTSKTWFGRRKTIKADQPVLQLPDCAVATKTANGQWHIAIHIPMSGDNEDLKPDTTQSRITEVKDSDTVSNFSRRFSKSTIANNWSRRQRRNSTQTVTSVVERDAPNKLSKAAPPVIRGITQTNYMPTPSRQVLSGMDTAENPPVQSSGTLNSPFQPGLPRSTSVPMLSMNDSASMSDSDYSGEDVNVHGGHRRSESQRLDVEYRQALLTEFAKPNRTTIGSPKQSTSEDMALERFPDLTRSSVSLASDVTSESRIARAKAKHEARHALQCAQLEEQDAIAVVVQAEQDARDTIPALETSTNMARSILRGAKASAAKAMEDADVAAAIAAAKQAAEAQSAIVTAERHIVGTKAHLENLLSAANARLVEAQKSAQAAGRELQVIALAEAKAEQDRLDAEERERERIIAEQKVAEQKRAEERAVQLAMEEARAIAEVRAAFAKADKEAATKAAIEAETQRVEAKALVRAASRKSRADSMIVFPTPVVKQDPEFRAMTTRLRKMEENNQVIMQTLNEVVRLGDGFKGLTHVLAADDLE
jgi:hypothetical protein